MEIFCYEVKWTVNLSLLFLRLKLLIHCLESPRMNFFFFIEEITLLQYLILVNASKYY